MADEPLTSSSFGPLGAAVVIPQIPVNNLARARQFYVDRLGLKVLDEKVPGVILLAAGGRTRLLLYVRPPVARGHAVAGFVVSDLDGTVAQMRAAGIRFLPFVRPQAEEHPVQVAWFRDSEGNILALNARL